MAFVIGASITLSWFFADEPTTHRDAVLDRVAKSGATLPAMWHLEIANALLVALRRRRVSAAFRDQAI
jgi:hypothetical protein